MPKATPRTAPAPSPVPSAPAPTPTPTPTDTPAPLPDVRAWRSALASALNFTGAKSNERAKIGPPDVRPLYDALALWGTSPESRAAMSAAGFAFDVGGRTVNPATALRIAFGDYSSLTVNARAAAQMIRDALAR